MKAKTEDMVAILKRIADYIPTVVASKETITRKMAPITRRASSFLVYFVCTLRGWRFQKLNSKEEEEETKKKTYQFTASL